MNNIKLVITAIMICTLGIFTVTAQTETKIGGFLAYGTEVNNIGIGVNAEFPIMEKLTLAPAFIYYLPKTEGFVKTNWFEFNANANYYFLQEDNLSVYGIGGVNFSSIKFSVEESLFFGSDLSSSVSNIGLNLGGGVNFNIGSKIEPFAELKYVIIDNSQLVLAAGVRYRF